MKNINKPDASTNVLSLENHKNAWNCENSDEVSSKESEQITFLREEAARLPQFQPSDNAWLAVKNNLPQPDGEKPSEVIAISKFTWPTLNYFHAMAASLAICCLTLIFTWPETNYVPPSLVAEAGDMVNQIEQQPLSSLTNEDLLWKLTLIDEQINESASTESLEILLTKRNAILAAMLKIQSSSSQLI